MAKEMTIGEYLAATRRRRQVEIETAADETKIRAEYLFKIEADDLEFLAPLYVRGFLRNYAHFLRVNPGPLIEAFDEQTAGAKADDTRQILKVNRSMQMGLGSSPLQTPKKMTPSFGGGSRERRKGANWSYAAVLAAIALLSLSVVGYLNEPRAVSQGAKASAADGPQAAGEEANAEPSVPADETAAPEKKRDKRLRVASLALRQGITLEIVATKAECWVLVNADGVDGQGEMLTLGEHTVYQANKTMGVILGNASGVELTVNGHRIGAPWEPGTTVLSLRLPRDLRSLI